ncbi:hypothetical protein [Cohnella cholangitidis]|uniref:Uncharacterized protein n=1 Tax=Cohnella cholangitidis TaxID=2598458 RepID=A0A7G5BTQ5_9BACL|nr:hypothetical protein [Cohnella cholangitidis]QMV40339.1 hypothetical protein FPL14_03320 [Cohnella cholangitidis]
MNQNGASYIAVDLVSQLLDAKNAFDPKKNELVFTSNKKTQEDPKIQQLNAKISKLEAQVTQLKERVNTLQATSNEAEGWIEYRSKYYTLFYTEQYKQDVEKVAEIFDHAREVAIREFKSIFPQVDTALNNEYFPIYIYLHPKATDQVSEGNVYNLGKGSANALTSEIHVISPSAYQTACCTMEGWKYDDSYIFKLFIHEYIHSPQHIVQEQYRKIPGWFPENQPNWIVEGLAEYFAYKDGDSYKQKLDYWKPIVLNKPQNHITVRNDSISVQTEYVGGFLFTAFLHEQYGSKKYESFLASRKSSMEEAFQETYGSFEKVNADWLKWLKL